MKTSGMTPISRKPRKGDELYLQTGSVIGYERPGEGKDRSYVAIKITGWLYDRPEGNIAKFEYHGTNKPGLIIVYFERTKEFNVLLFDDMEF